MATTPTVITTPVGDLAGQPLPSLIVTADLLGVQKPAITDNNEIITNLTTLGATSSGAQSTGPGAPVLVVRSSGGSIAAGTYDCLWTFYDGAESLPGTITTVTTTGSTSSLVHTIPAIPTGAIRAYAYRQKDASGHFYRIGQVDDRSRTTFIDTLAEASITSNPEPASSAPAVGTLTFVLMAPGDISDLANPSAVPLYKLTIGSLVYYTTSFAHSGTPLDLASILAAPATAGIVTRINWKLIDPSEGPQVGVISTFAISRTCVATDTGAVLLANAPSTNTDDGGSDSLGLGHIFLKPNAETSNPDGWYIATLKPGETPVRFQCPMPDGGGHPDGFDWDELTFIATAFPQQQIASIANIQAVTTELDTPQTDPLTTANMGEDELINIRERFGADKGLVAGHWKDPRATLVATGDITGGGIIGTTGAYMRAQHLAGYPGSQQVTLSAPATAAGSGATLTTITGTVMAGDLNSNNIVLHSGTGPTTGKLFSVTFKLPYTNVPTYTIVPGDKPTRALGLTLENVTITGMEVHCSVAPDVGINYSLGWIGVGR